MNNQYLDARMEELRGEIERYLQEAVTSASGDGLEPLRHMMAYHMGWETEGSSQVATGKRLRPILLLLCTGAAGGDWQDALPAAAAVELIHNFSLIHDDIEDNSPLRHGRPTLWKLWGVPQATNTGDAMFTLAHLVVHRLSETISPDRTLLIARRLLEACLHLTQGQYMDLAYEGRGDLSLEAYWPMVSGKTAALLSACTELGAQVAGADGDTCDHYARFGRLLGLAFQAQDDLLGIWGEPGKTGKSAKSDLVSGKKTLPVLYGLSQGGSFARRWLQGSIAAEEVSGLAEELKQEGAYDYTQTCANQLTQDALQALDHALPSGEDGSALRSLALRLVHRHH